MTKLITLIVRQGALATQDAHVPESNGGSFLTKANVLVLLQKEPHKSIVEDLTYVPQPSYLVEIFHKPYPIRYEAPRFILFDGRKGNPKEHVNRFIDGLGPHAGNHDLHIKEFSKSLIDRAYTWYTSLTSSSIRN